MTSDHAFPSFAPSSADLDLTIIREVAVLPAVLFRVWTTRLPDWFGPHGMRTRVLEMDLRTGGAFRTVMRAPDGTEHPTRGVFLEVCEPERIVFTDAFDPGWRPNPEIFFTAVTTFEALPGGRTRYTASARHWTLAARQQHEQMGFFQGWGESIDRLVTLAANLSV